MATTATDTRRKQDSQGGFSSIQFGLGLVALGLALVQILGHVFHQNLLDWYRQDAEHARQLGASVPVALALGQDALDTRVALRRGESFEAMRDAHLARLALNPANGRYWSRYAVDLQRYRHQGDALEQAVARSLALYPQSIENAIEQSVIAAYNWSSASEATRQSWNAHLTLALSHPRLLGYHANRSGVAKPLCSIPRVHDELKDWCVRLPAYEAACHSANANADVRKWCQQAGFATP